MINMAAQDAQGQLLQPDRKEREQELQGQENLAVYQVLAATDHRQVNGEGDEGDVVEGSGARQLFGAHHDFAQARAQKPAAILPPVNGHGPQAQVEQVAAGASQDKYRHVASNLALPAEETGHQGDQDEDVQAEARDQKQNFGAGTKFQVVRDSAQGSRRVIHGREVTKAVCQHRLKEH